MRAIVIATGHSEGMEALNERHPTEMIPLGDRPFIQHVVERLIDKGVTEFDFILSHLPEKIEQLLGDGARWGSRFRYHLVKGHSSLYPTVRSLGLRYGEYSEFLLATADRLPDIDVDIDSPDLQYPVVFCAENSEWTGWAVLSSRAMMKIVDDLDESSLGAELIAIARSKGSVIKVSKLLSAQSYEKVLSSQELLLSRRVSGLMLSGRESDDQIWISRNVSLHPTTKLTAPVYIGENCHIGLGVHLGPNAVVGADCMLDARCTVSDSLILSGSYVGEGLELACAIVDKNRLINTSVGMAISVADDFILGSLSENYLKKTLTGLFSRLTACLLLLVAWPLLLVTALWLKVFRGGPVLYKKEVVHLPAESDSSLWRTFRLWSFSSEESSKERSGLGDILLRLLPSLVSIASGDLHFVGVRPRSRQEIESLPTDWRSLYLKAKAGAITEAFVLYGERPTEDELYSTEAFYSVSSGFRRDLKLVFAYLARSVSP